MASKSWYDCRCQWCFLSSYGRESCQEKDQKCQASSIVIVVVNAQALNDTRVEIAPAKRFAAAAISQSRHCD